MLSFNLAYKIYVHEVNELESFECIFFQLAKASQTGSRYWNQKVAGLNLTGVQAMVVRFLYESDHVTANDLGNRTGLDSATLTGIIDRLETAQFLERKPHHHDRRALQIQLTEKGRGAGKEIYGLMKDANEEFLKVFNHKEQKQLRSYLTRMRSSLNP